MSPESIADHFPEETRRIQNRLRRIEGQLRGIQTMIDEGRDCESILHQVLAARSGMSQVAKQVIATSMKTCLIDAEGKSSDEIIDEAIAVFERYANVD